MTRGRRRADEFADLRFAGRAHRGVGGAEDAVFGVLGDQAVTDQQHCAHGAASLIANRRLARGESAATSANAASTRRTPARSAAPTTESSASRARTASSVAATRSERRRGDRQRQRRRRADLDDRGEIADRIEREQRLVESRQRQLAAARQRRAGADAAGEAVEPLQRRSAGAGRLDQPREIAGAVAQQRRAAPPQRGDDDFAERARRRRRAAGGIDDLDQQLVLAQMAAAVEGAIDRAAVAGLGHAPMAEDFGAPGRGQRARDALGDMVGTQQHGARADRRAAVIGGDARRREQRNRRPGDDVRPLVSQPGGERDRIERRRRNDRRDAKTAQRDREPCGDAARMAAGKGDRRPVARSREQRHAVVEEIDGRFEIVGGEMEPLRRTAGARGLERDDARDGALRQRQQRRIVGEAGRPPS